MQRLYVLIMVSLIAMVLTSANAATAAETELEAAPLGIALVTELDIDDSLAVLYGRAELANVDLQSRLQKMQQTLQQISNLAKLNNDTALTVIRNFGG